jgi:hypothetical protein
VLVKNFLALDHHEDLVHLTKQSLERGRRFGLVQLDGGVEVVHEILGVFL